MTSEWREDTLKLNIWLKYGFFKGIQGVRYSYDRESRHWGNLNQEYIGLEQLLQGIWSNILMFWLSTT